ncbi:MAG: TIGR02757 family protein [Ignavibacteriaceae bacterium]|nr:TIGR02757 family protein [Ignavibacteriaceae bacterium]
MNLKHSSLREKLEYHYKAFDKSKLEPDPLQFPHLFKDEKDIEVMAFIASICAYGNVKQINSSLKKFLELSDNKPFSFIQNFKLEKSNIGFSLVHRFYSSKDILQLYHLLNGAYDEFGSLKSLFQSGYNETDNNTKNAITNFSTFFLEKTKIEFGKVSAGIKFMFPLPEKGSACKRMNLFLRWMVRKDELDFGLWREIPTSKLIIPVDTHIARICKQLKLTKRKNVSWKMAEEITENLKKFDPDDPVKYDFTICHIGMRKLNF